MTPERWARVEEIFHAAADHPAATRDAYLDGACGDDTELRTEVASLLAESERADGLPSAGLVPIAWPVHGLARGTRVGTYEIQSLLGAGGMGEVYCAHDTKLERDVAVKVLPQLVSADPDRLARLQREARVLASLNHPNIGAIHGIVDAAGIRALILELIDGETLADRIARGPLPVARAIALARQIADALEAAHEKGIVHRDLKPANIKITPADTVKVLDFGLAKLMPQSGVAAMSSLSASGTEPLRIGTAAYMSPEQARGHAVDKRADVWAFGCVLYEMLTGQRAFPGETSSGTIAALLEREPAWDALPSGTPAGIRRVLHRALEKEPTRRLHDIADARLELEDAVGSENVDARPGQDIRRARRVAWLTGGGVAVAAAMAAAVTAAYLRHAPPDAIPVAFEIATPPTDEPMSFALSPDGRQLAFVASTAGESRLWVRPLAQTQAFPLAGTERAMMPFWSPDGRAIGFFADGKLKRTDVTGGVPQVVGDAPEPRGGAWSPDGTIVFAPFTGGDLMAVPATGGRAAPTTARGRWPQFLPDGRRFLYFYFVGPSDVQGVYVGSLDGREPVRIMSSESAALYAAPDHLLVAHEGKLLAWRFDPVRAAISGDPSEVAGDVGSDGRLGPAFSAAGTSVLAERAGTGQRREFVWVDRVGHVLGTLLPPDDTVLAHPELAPDGRHVAFQRYQQGDNNIWLLDVLRGVATQFTMDGGVYPKWTRDGGEIIYRRGLDLVEKAADGTARERTLPLHDASMTAFDVSADRRFLLYGIHSGTNGSDLWVLPLVGNGKPFPVVQTRGEDTSGEFSPDGRWLLYQSDVSGRYEIYIQPVDGRGQRVQISTAGGIWPRWGTDAKAVFYVAPDDQLMAAPLTVRGPGEMPEPGVPVALFTTRFAMGGNIARFGGKAKPQYSVSADGRFLVNMTAGQPTPFPITVVLNWTAALRR